jgi:hypothetical protein
VSSAPEHKELAPAGIQLVGSTHSQLLGTKIQRLVKIRHGHTTIYNTKYKYRKQDRTSTGPDNPVDNTLQIGLSYTARETEATLRLGPVNTDTLKTPPTSEKRDTTVPTTPCKRKYTWLQTADI